jgi:hypothetical protein
MKTLEESDDEYNISFEELTDKFKEGMKKGKDHKVLHKNFQKNFQKILSKRERDSKHYIKHNKQKILGLPKKKKKKKEEKKVFNPKQFDFRQSLFERMLRKMKFLGFYVRIKAISLWHSKLIVFFRVSFLKKKIFLSSIFLDVKLFFTSKFKRIISFSLKYFGKIKIIYKNIYVKLKAFLKKIVEKVSLVKKQIKQIFAKIYSLLTGKKVEATAEEKPLENNAAKSVSPTDDKKAEEPIKTTEKSNPAVN